MFRPTIYKRPHTYKSNVYKRYSVYNGIGVYKTTPKSKIVLYTDFSNYANPSFDPEIGPTITLPSSSRAHASSNGLYIYDTANTPQEIWGTLPNDFFDEDKKYRFTNKIKINSCSVYVSGFFGFGAGVYANGWNSSRGGGQTINGVMLARGGVYENGFSDFLYWSDPPIDGAYAIGPNPRFWPLDQTDILTEAVVDFKNRSIELFFNGVKSFSYNAISIEDFNKIKPRFKSIGFGCQLSSFFIEFVKIEEV